MKHTWKKIASLALTLAMAGSLLNVAAMATDVPEHVHNEGGWTCSQGESTQEPTCGMVEHVHIDDCSITSPVQNCTDASEEHVHTDDCYVTPADACPTYEHTHGEECYAGAWTCEAPAAEIVNPYVSGQSKWNTPLITFAPTSDGVPHEITYTSAKSGSEFTQAEVDAMDAATIAANRLFVSKITFIIPEDFSASTLNIFAADAVNDALNYIRYMPGDAAALQIEIVNLSAHSYSYTDNSFAISTEDYRQYFDLGWATASEFIGYDGQSIPVQYLARRTTNSALIALYNASSVGKVTTAMLSDATLGAKLIEKGYTGGINDLNLYYLEFYNEFYGTTHTKLEDFADSEIGVITAATFAAQGQVETNMEVAELMYNYYYNHLYSASPAGVNPGSVSNDYTIGTLMAACNNGIDTPFETGLQSAWGDIQASDSEEGASYLWEGMENWINGPDTRNAYMNYNCGYTFGLSLERTDMPGNDPILPPDTIPTTPDEEPTDPPEEPVEENAEEPAEEPSEIEEEDVPTTEAPVIEEPVEEIVEEEPPMAEAPKTGDSADAWLAVAALSGLGLVVLTVSSMKRKEEEV